MFYIEDTYLKFGKKGKEISSCIDLKDAQIIIDKKNNKKFKIYVPKTKLKLKAESLQDREQWIKALSKVTNTIIDI